MSQWIVDSITAEHPEVIVSCSLKYFNKKGKLYLSGYRVTLYPPTHEVSRLKKHSLVAKKFYNIFTYYNRYWQFSLKRTIEFIKSEAK